MHDDELAIDVGLVRRLVAGLFPALRDLSVREVRSTGTVNAIYRLGDDLCVRLPRLAGWADDLEAELTWLPRLASRLSLPVPAPVARGAPACGYPLPWAIYRWIEGRPYADGLIDDERRAAEDLARFVLELRAIEASDGAPRGGRRPLRELDAETRTAIEAGRGLVDRDAATAAWERALEAPARSGAPVWVHADLLRPNVLVRDGRLCGVIDFGSVGVGDPAADVIAAWSVLGRPGRAAFRDALDVDDGTWERARGYALHQAALIVPYYRETNPHFVELARRTIGELLPD